MTPTKEELDSALNEIKATFLSRETKLAKTYAEHPDPDAWYLNFISCLAKVAAGPPVPPPSTTGHKQPAAGVGVRLGVEAEVKPEAANDSGGCDVTLGVGTTSRKRPRGTSRVEDMDGGSNMNVTGTGKKVRVEHSMSTGETEYRTAEGVLVGTTMTGTDTRWVPSSGLTTATGNLEVHVNASREEEETETRGKTAMVSQEEVTKQEMEEIRERPARRRRLTRGIRPRKRILASESD
ncbi:hypothetical protein B0T13DRAFT_314517 [Neurospora crassa]|nr:hypothetical protein B0T13DRAFT_314517 [Neurospora crassa]